MDIDSIYLITKQANKINSAHQIDKVSLQKSAWVLYGRHIPVAFEKQLQKEKRAAVARWQLADYEVLLLAEKLSSRLTLLCHQHKLDYAFIGELPSLHQPGLALFDMDSTAIEIECIDEIAKLAGVGEQVARITEQAMRGELDFKASLEARVALLKGMDASLLKQINLPLTAGMQELCIGLQHFGWYIAIASGGFTFFSDQLKQRLPLCDAKANQLEIVEGRLTGRLLGEILDAKAKATILHQLAKDYCLSLAQTIAVGDGANDLAMMDSAALGIAYKAKTSVAQKAQISIQHADLVGVFCILSASLFLSQ